MKIFFAVLTLLLELFLFSALKISSEISREEENHEDTK